MRRTFLLFLTQKCLFSVLCLIDSDLIQSYFEVKSVQSATIFGCLNKKERVELTKKLATHNRAISVLNIQQQRVEDGIKTPHGQIGVVLDADCDKSQDFLIKCGHSRLFGVKHHWLIQSSSHAIIGKFQAVSLNMDADIHVAVKNSTGWVILDVFNPAFGLGGVLKSVEMGFYDSTRGYRMRSQEPKFWGRRNLTGVTFKTVITLIEPHTEPLEKYLKSDTNRTTNRSIRYQHSLLLLCAGFYNYTLTTELSHAFGYLLPNGSFDGMVGAMERKQIHFGSSPIFLRRDRLNAVTYGRGTWKWKAGFMFRIPKSRGSLDTFLKPLSTSTWVISALLIASSVVILKIVTTFEGKGRRSEASWSWSVMFILGAVCQQGSSCVPKMVCGRVTTLSVFLLSVLLYQFYSASIVSNLLMRPRNRIKSLKDLLESSLKVGCEDIVYSRDLFAHPPDKVIRDLYYKKIYGKDNTTHYFTPRRGLELVKNGGYAFHVEAERAYPIIEKTFSHQAICDLREVKMLKFTDLYTTYQKESPFYNMLETCIQKLDEHGIMSKEVKNWQPRKPECIQTAQSSSTFHVGLEDFYPALLVFLAGAGLSLGIFVLEMCFHPGQEKKKKGGNFQRQQDLKGIS